MKYKQKQHEFIILNFPALYLSLYLDFPGQETGIKII